MTAVITAVLLLLSDTTPSLLGDQSEPTSAGVFRVGARERPARRLSGCLQVGNDWLVPGVPKLQGSVPGAHRGPRREGSHHVENGQDS